MKYLENPELRPKIEAEVEASVVPTSSIDADKYKKNIEDIKQKVLELKSPYEQAIAKANEWRENAFNNLNASSADYQSYKEQISQVYDDMVRKANETALSSSKSLEDGFKRGLSRIIIRQSITKPLIDGIGSYFGFAMAHTGGIIGADSLATKSASSLAFVGAPRFHGGGIVGDEVPIIAKCGEGVFTREQMKALGDNGSTVNISVNVINNAASDVKASVSQSNQGNGKFNLDIMIEKIESSMSRNVSKGTGLAPVLERRYGLNPAYGSYG